MANGRGGYQRPRNPAAWSGPGQMSQRTDGNEPGRISGLPYGENAPANELRQAASQTGEAGVGAPPSRPPGGGAPSGAQLPDVFGPTKRPGEPITAGAPGGPQVGPQARRDPDMPLRALARESLDKLGYIHPELRMLLERRDLG